MHAAVFSGVRCFRRPLSCSSRNARPRWKPIPRVDCYYLKIFSATRARARSHSDQIRRRSHIYRIPELSSNFATAKHGRRTFWISPSLHLSILWSCGYSNDNPISKLDSIKFGVIGVILMIGFLGARTDPHLHRAHLYARIFSDFASINSLKRC